MDIARIWKWSMCKGYCVRKLLSLYNYNCKYQCVLLTLHCIIKITTVISITAICPLLECGVGVDVQKY